MGCRRYSAALRFEVPLDEEDFRSFLTSSWTQKFSASFTPACDNPGTLKSRSISSNWVSPFLFDLRLRLCLQFVQALTHNSGWILVHPRVSPFLKIGFLVLVGFVGCPCCFQLLLNPILSSNYLWRTSLEEAEVTHILSRMWFLQIPSQQLSRYNKLGVYREGWLHYILFDRIWILYVEQGVIDPIHRVLVSFPRFLLVPCKLVRIFVFLVHGIHSREEYCLSFPVWILSSRYQSWIDDGV